VEDRGPVPEGHSWSLIEQPFGAAP
jgi:hypothetical protein